MVPRSRRVEKVGKADGLLPYAWLVIRSGCRPLTGVSSW
jgi:hypothetical protein